VDFGSAIRVIETRTVSTRLLPSTYRKRIYNVDIIILERYPLSVYVGSNRLARLEDT